MPDLSLRRTSPIVGREAPRRRAAFARRLTLGALLVLAGPAAAQQVDVRFAHPRGYIDAQNGAGPDLPLRGTLREFAGIVRELGRRYLRPGDHLDVTVLQLDVAGIPSLGYGVAAGPRIVNGATPPQIRLAYALRRDGRLVARGTDSITDPNFLITQNPRYSSGPLYYEQRVLTGWFEDRFRYGRGLSAVSG